MTATAAVPEAGYTVPELLKATGLTYRTIDYWARRGVIDAPAAGSGHPRHWDAHDVAVLRTLARLRHPGRPGYGLPLAALARVARLLGHHAAEAGWVVLAGVDGPVWFVTDGVGFDSDRLSELLALEEVAVIVRFDPWRLEEGPS